MPRRDASAGRQSRTMMPNGDLSACRPPVLGSVAMNGKLTGSIGAVLLFSMLASVAPMGADSTDGAEKTPTSQPHVVFIVIDTLRYDHTSLAGYHRDTTPALKRIADQGLNIENHFSNAPWTKASVATMLTGLLPGARGAQWGSKKVARDRKVDILPAGFVTLPEVLQQHGYRTHSFMTNVTLTASLGYAQGFDQYLIRAACPGAWRFPASCSPTISRVSTGARARPNSPAPPQPT